MRKRIKWTKMYIVLLVLSVAFAILLFGQRMRMPESAAADWRVITEKETSAVEIARININTADENELTMLPGIGETLAERIVAYRRENGNFSAPEELLEVSGIGEATLENIRNYIVLEEVQP